jgi:hypothetical protein
LNPLRRFAPLAIAVGIACVINRPTPVAFNGCSVDAAAVDYVIRTAANVIIGNRGADGQRIRSLANVPLAVDSVRARSRVVTDRAVCGQLWRALDSEERHTQVTVVQIGSTYWVRLPRAIHAFDGAFRWLIAVVDL